MDLHADRVVTSDQLTDDWIESVDSGVTLEWIHNRQILRLQLTSISFGAVDAWINAVLHLLANHPVDRPCLAIYDFSDEQITLTPYIKSRAQEIARAFPDVKGRVAVLSPRGGAGRLLRLFVNQLMRIDRGRQMQVFFTRGEAVAWLTNESA